VVALAGVFLLTKPGTSAETGTAAGGPQTRVALINLSYVFKWYTKFKDYQSDIEQTLKKYEEPVKLKQKRLQEIAIELRKNPASHFRQFRTSDENLRTNLENLIHDLDKYLKFYRMSYSLLYPVFFILMLIFVIMDRGMHDFLEAIQETKMIICLILVIVIFLASSLWFTNWYLKKLYGNHVEKLKLLLKDISELGDEIA
jgi:hypothetical protein